MSRLHYANEVKDIMQKDELSWESTSSSPYQQSYRATCNLKISIGGFAMNHLIWNFVFTQYLGPSAFRKTKALGSSFKQWEYRGPSFYCSYCSHRTVRFLSRTFLLSSTISHSLTNLHRCRVVLLLFWHFLRHVLLLANSQTCVDLLSLCLPPCSHPCTLHKLLFRLAFPWVN